MKKKTSTKASGATEPVVEYDFSNGVRGKYAERYRAARVTVQLDPDVAQEFPDSASANDALRALLRLRRGESTTDFTVRIDPSPARNEQPSRPARVTRAR